jgi:xylulokinase
MKRLLGKRWIATGGTLLRTNVNGTASTIGLGALSAVVELTVEQAHLMVDDRRGYWKWSRGRVWSALRLRTQTGSTTDTLSSNATSGGIAPSTALTTPDLGSSTNEVYRSIIRSYTSHTCGRTCHIRF